jgi:hypothetical protein
MQGGRLPRGRLRAARLIAMNLAAVLLRNRYSKRR